MTDPLGVWWVHPVQVARFRSVGVENAENYADPVTVTGFYRDGQTNVRDQSGDMVKATGRFAYPHDTATIPLRSQLTLPDTFGGQVVQVVATAVADGPVGTPEHKIVGVK